MAVDDRSSYREAFLTPSLDPAQFETSVEGEPPEIHERPDAELPIDSMGSFQGPFFQAVGKRKLESRDAKILVTADHAQTGVGKSNCCDFLGYVLDTTERGFAPHKIAIDPPEFFAMYGKVPLESAIVLEEGEQLDPRRAMSNQNVDARQTWAKERVRELVALINLPSPEMIDGDLELLADFWVNVERRGRAKIYQKKVNRMKGLVYYETMQILEWPNMDGSETFRKMNREKMDHLDDDQAADNWIRQSEVDELLERREKEIRTEVRDDLLTSLYRETELTAADIARCSAVDIGASRVRQIANRSG